MSSAAGADAGEARRRRRLAVQIADSLRDLRNQLSLLNNQVGVRLRIRSVDLDCLDLIARHGPLSPSALAHRAGLHPATMTGILDRLQRAGWVTRERDPDATDRRAVSVRAVPERSREIYRHYAGMYASLREICDRYSTAELAVLADFLDRTSDAGRHATDQLGAD